MPRPPRMALLLALSTLACAARPGETAEDTSTAAPASTGDETGAPTTDIAPTTGDPGDTATTDATTTTPDPTTHPGTATGTTTSDTTGGDALSCPPSIDAAIAACIAALQADPELGEDNFLIDLLLLCSDAEPVADDYDAYCAATPDDPICSLEYQAFVEQVLPQCVARVQDQLFADVCLFPETYADLLFAPAIALMKRRTVLLADDLTPSEQDQLVAAAHDLGLPVDSAAAALAATDDGRVEQLTVLDVGTDRTLVLYTGRYDDSLRGRAYFRDSFIIIGAVEDGVFSRCAVERGIEGQPCETDEPCAPDHECNDILKSDNDDILAPGVCIDPNSSPGEGDGCTAHADCDPSLGLLCLDALQEGDPGTCRPGWMRRSFAGPSTPLQPGGISSVAFTVSGLATVPTAAFLDLTLTQDTDNLLELRLLNPLGTVSAVTVTSATAKILDLEPVPVPGDESAGGVWHLEVEDLGGQAVGTVVGVALTLDSRWD